MSAKVTLDAYARTMNIGPVEGGPEIFDLTVAVGASGVLLEWWDVTTDAQPTSAYFDDVEMQYLGSAAYGGVAPHVYFYWISNPHSGTHSVRVEYAGSIQFFGYAFSVFGNGGTVPSGRGLVKEVGTHLQIDLGTKDSRSLGVGFAWRGSGIVWANVTPGAGMVHIDDYAWSTSGWICPAIDPSYGGTLAMILDVPPAGGTWWIAAISVNAGEEGSPAAMTPVLRT